MEIFANLQERASRDRTFCRAQRQAIAPALSAFAPSMTLRAPTELMALF
jgi:hypothetical protein